MKMIDVLNLMAKGEIKEETKLIVSADLVDYEYRYSKGYNAFFNKHSNRIEDDFFLDEDFLNIEVELIPPKEKKYLVKFNMRGWREFFNYLNYYKKTDSIEINNNIFTDFAKTQFTKSELQSIQPVREFLEDMQGKYELVEVTEDEDY